MADHSELLSEDRTNTMLTPVCLLPRPYLNLPTLTLPGTPDSGHVGDYVCLWEQCYCGGSGCCIGGAPAIPAVTAGAGSTYTYDPGFIPTARVSTVSGTTLVFSIGNKPSWCTFDSSTGILTGIPQTSDIGVVHQDIVICLTEGSSNSVNACTAGGLNPTILSETVYFVPIFQITVTDETPAPVPAPAPAL